MTAPQPQQAPGAPAAGGTDGQAPTGNQPQDQQNQQAQGQQGNGTESGTQPPAKTDLATLPADVRKIIEDARAGEAKYRTEKQAATAAAAAETAKLNGVLAAMGIKADGSPADQTPEQLTAAVEQAQNAVWATAVENTVLRTAQAAGADADRLLDSRAFIGSLDEFADQDPHNAEFKTKLAAHIKTYVEQNPTLKSASGTARSGGELGTGGEARTTRPTSLSAAITQAYSR